MAHTDSDRRRFFLATAITLMALPALWWANESRQSAPNVATAGVEVGDAAEPTTAAVAATTVPAPAPTQDPEPPPVFLDGPAGQVGAGLPEVAVPATTGERFQTRATYRSNLPSTTTCIVGGVNNGEDIVVVNLDNGRSVRCRALLAPFGVDPMLVLSSQQFLEIADPTDAPIPVEIRR